MTEENQKKLYEHFLKTEQKERAEAVLVVYPDFKEVEPETKSKVKK